MTPDLRLSQLRSRLTHQATRDASIITAQATYIASLEQLLDQAARDEVAPEVEVKP